MMNILLFSGWAKEKFGDVNHFIYEKMFELTTNDNEEPQEFAIAGADKKFVWAKAKIENDKIIVSSDEISEPEYVRYAWADTPVNPNLINKEGLPSPPFRTNK